MGRRLASVLACALALAGCGDDGESSEGASRAPETTTAATTSAGTTTRAAEPLDSERLRLQVIAEGLESPVHVTAAPGEGERLYVVEQEGRIRVVEGGRVRAEAFLDISDEVACCGEQGLFSVAFHPDYARNRRFYVDFTNENGDTRVVEYSGRRRRRACRRRERPRAPRRRPAVCEPQRRPARVRPRRPPLRRHG